MIRQAKNIFVCFKKVFTFFSNSRAGRAASLSNVEREPIIVSMRGLTAGMRPHTSAFFERSCQYRSGLTIWLEEPTVEHCTFVGEGVRR